MALILLALFSDTILASDNPDRKFITDIWTANDGLPVNNLGKIIQSKTGFLWMVSPDGLVRFDGIRFKTYQRENYPALLSNRLNGIAEASDGTLWLKSEQSDLFRFHEGRFQRMTNEDGLNGRYASKIYTDQNGEVWIGADEGISFVNGDQIKPFRENLIRGNIDRIFVESSGAVWYSDADSGNVYRYKEGETRFIMKRYRTDFLPFHEDDEGTIWIGTGLTIHHFKNDSLSTFSVLDEISEGPTHIGQDQHGRVWIASYENGFYYADNDRLNHFSESAGEAYTFFDPFIIGPDGHFRIISRSRIWKNEREILQIDSEFGGYRFDSEGNFWAGTNGGKLLRMKPNHFTTFSTPEGIPGQNIYAVMEDQNGTIWAGTHGDGLATIENFRVTDAPALDRPDNVAYVWSLFQRSDDSILAGLLGGGLFELTAESEVFSGKISDPRFSGEQIFSIYEDNSNRLWIGTSEGVFRKTEGQWDQLDISGHPVRFFKTAPDGSLWMGSNGDGLINYKNGRVVKLSTEDGYPSDIIRSIHITESSEPDTYVMWIGTEDIGMYRLPVVNGAFSPDDITKYRTASGLPNFTVHIILKDKNRRFWLNTNQGIYTVPYTDLEAYHRGETSRLNGTTFNESDGMRNSEGNGGMQPAGILASDGRIWLPTQDGLVTFHPDTLLSQNRPPKVEVDQVLVGGINKIDASSPQIKLAKDKRDFEFSFTSLSMTAPQKNRFKYRLAGFNDSWIDAGNRRSTAYTNIPPGTYTFEVIGSNHLGSWSSEPARMTITISPWFYETSWFRALVIIAIILLIYSGFRLRIRKLEKNEKLLQEKVDQQTEMLSLEMERTAKQAEELKELNQAKTRFFANISHEFRTPLTLIKGPVQHILSNGNTLEVKHIEQELRMVLNNAERLRQLINQTLELTQLDNSGLKLSVQEIRLKPFLEKILELFRPVVITRSLELNLELQNSDQTVYADPEKLQQIISNLISNAVKFTPDGGNVMVTVSTENDATHIKVSDSGIGISQKELTKIFERFYQADNSVSRIHEGSGIGLSLARDYVLAHQGVIYAESPGEGSGTTMTITLKNGYSHFTEEEIQRGRQLDEEQLKRKLSSDKKSQKRRSGKPAHKKDEPVILLVEDNPEMRIFIKRVVSERWTVTEAANGMEALEKIRQATPDLIIADIMMPQMDGFTFNQHLKNNPDTASVPVIFLTAKASRASEISGYEVGGDAYLTKPFDPEILISRIENLLRSRLRLREFLTRQINTKIPQNGKNGDDSFLNKVKAVLAQSYMNPDFSVSDLAAKLNINRSNLYRKTKVSAGLTPNELMKQYRMEKSLELLKSGEHNISEVAYAVGFNSLTYFSYSFREYYKKTPSEVLEEVT